jgi:hypothetical protein
MQGAILSQAESSMMTAVPKKFYSWDYRVLDETKHPVAEILSSSWRHRGSVKIGDKVYRVFRGKFLGPSVFKTPDQSMAASVTRPRAFKDAFEISYEGRCYRLESISVWRRSYGLFSENRMVGSMTPKWFKRWTLDFQDEVPLLLRMIATWLTLWKH